MDYALQVHEAKYVFPIPDGLKELSSDIIREVLRHQPEHINGFIADYLETMLIVRENARDSGVLVCDAFRQGYFFDELFKNKNVNREQANAYATTIQAAWRGYVVRTKVRDWLKKKKKFEEEKERKKSLKIEELLAGLGITYDEATRAAALIQTAYKDSKRGVLISNEFGEFWVGETVPFGQRIREGDRAMGRFDRWEKEDFGDFFEMDELGAIKYVWPRLGQLRKVPRDEVPEDATIIEFFGMRDLQGREQYSYLLKTHPGSDRRGTPIGFLTPLPKASLLETTLEVEFTDPDNIIRMGNYTYVFRDDCTREDLEKFEELIKAQESAPLDSEIAGEFDYDPHWVLPRALVRIKKEFLLETDDEVKFSVFPTVVLCEQEVYTFRAETLPLTAKLIRQILREKCLTIAEALAEAGNMSPYKIQETGRIFPVELFSYPHYIQKIEIVPETETGEAEALDSAAYTYIFLPVDLIRNKKLGAPLQPFPVPITRFQGFHSEYRGSADLENKVFIMGPKMATPNGKPLTYEALFWDEFGEEAWHQLLYNITVQEDLGEEEEQPVQDLSIEREEGLEIEGEGFGEKEFSETQEKPAPPSEPTDSVKGGQPGESKPVEAPPAPEPSEVEGETKPEVQGEEKEPEPPSEPQQEKEEEAAKEEPET